jgi:hypothetical protein
MHNYTAEEVDAKIRYAVEVSATSLETLCKCRIAPDGAGDTVSIIPAGVDYVVFGDTSGPEVDQATKYLQSLGLKVTGVDIDTVPDECRTFDTAFLPVVLEVRTGGLFIGNPATSREGFDAWRHRS